MTQSKLRSSCSFEHLWKFVHPSFESKPEDSVQIVPMCAMTGKLGSFSQNAEILKKKKKFSQNHHSTIFPWFLHMSRKTNTQNKHERSARWPVHCSSVTQIFVYWSSLCISFGLPQWVALTINTAESQSDGPVPDWGTNVLEIALTV